MDALAVQRDQDQRAIAEKIRQAIAESGFTLDYIARKVGKGKATVSDWQNGRTAIGAVEIARLARVLNRPVSYFYDELPTRERPRLASELVSLANRAGVSLPPRQLRIAERFLRVLLEEAPPTRPAAAQGADGAEGFVKPDEVRTSPRASYRQSLLSAIADMLLPPQAA